MREREATSIPCAAMAHHQEFEFIAAVKAALPQFFSGQRVLEVGSLDINGSIRTAFDACDYVGADLSPAGYPRRDNVRCWAAAGQPVPGRSLTVVRLDTGHLPAVTNAEEFACWGRDAAVNCTA